MLIDKALNPIFHPNSHSYQVSNRTPQNPIFSPKIELCSTLSEVEGPFFFPPPISAPHPHFYANIEPSVIHYLPSLSARK